MPTPCVATPVVPTLTAAPPVVPTCNMLNKHQLTVIALYFQTSIRVMGAFIIVMLAALFGIANTLLDSEHTLIGKISGDSIDMETKGGLHMFEVFKKKSS